MEEPNHIDQAGVSAEEPLAQPAEATPSAEDEHVGDVSKTQEEGNENDIGTEAVPVEVEALPVETLDAESDASPVSEPDTISKDESAEVTPEELSSGGESPDHSIQEEASGDSDPKAEDQDDTVPEMSTVLDEPEKECEPQVDAQPASVSQDIEDDSSAVDSSATGADVQDEAPAAKDSESLERRHSVRTEALIQAAARAVVALRDDGETEAEDDTHDDEAPLIESYTSNDYEPSESADGADDTTQLHREDAVSSRPGSSASRSLSSPTGQSSVGDGTENGSHRFEDDVFSDRSPRSPRSSVHSADQYFDDDAFEQMTEKGDQSPYVRSRVTSGVSVSGASEMSELSRLSRYEKEDFVPESRNNRPAFRSPSSVRAIQMSSPTPSAYASPKRPTAFPTISRLGSPQVSGQFSPKSRPSRLKRQEPAPLVLLHVTLLPLRWGYGDVINHFEAKKESPEVFSSEGIKNLRSAWRQLQDRLGDTVLERGILLPHPQNDYEILEERTLEALELPLRRRARILECGHYLGPSNIMTTGDEAEDDSEDSSDTEESETEAKPEKRHWCKTCKGEIKYEELGSERMFRIKVYASNGLMSPGAWEACWKEMERVDIEVEPIIDSTVQSELAKVAAAFDQEHQQQIEAEQNQQVEEEQRLQLEIEQRLSLEEERHQLEVQRQQFEEERRRAVEETERKLELERQKFEETQRQRLEEERRQQFEEDRQLLEAQRQEFEEQRIELEQQRKLVEEEQRQHLEEARRQELEEEQRLIEEQRQQLEDARQQFEEERRQRLEEEEELRRLQREEDEQKQMAAPRATSRASYVEDEIVSPLREGAASTDLDGRRRDSDRLREIYGAHSRASSDALANTSSPSIHIHVDSRKQREAEQNSQQLATIPAPRDSILPAANIHETGQADSYMASSQTSATPGQAYPRREEQHRSLDSASLPELVGETIRVLLQDPKNVAIAVLVVFIAMLAGFTKREEHGVETFKPQPQYQHQQMDSRNPAGQVIMNTPTTLVETVYKTITSEAPQQKIQATREVEIVYHTVTQQPIQEAPTRVVETVYSTVTQSFVQAPPAQAAFDDPAAHRAASELPTVADPSIALPPLLFDSVGDKDTVFVLPPFSCITPGMDPFVCCAAFIETYNDVEPSSNEPNFKDINEADSETSLQASSSTTVLEQSSAGDATVSAASTTMVGEDDQLSSPTATSTVQEYKTTTTTETVTETIYATPSVGSLELKASSTKHVEEESPGMEFTQRGLTAEESSAAPEDSPRKDNTDVCPNEEHPLAIICGA